MKISLEVNSPAKSQAMFRVAEALERYAPSGQFVAEAEADVVLLHVIGYPETVANIERLAAQGKRAVIVQYCLRTTQEPHTSKWLPLWQQALMVWSYYDLPACMKADGVEGTLTNFCFGPLGAEPSLFPYRNYHKDFKIFTSGYVAETEGVCEASEAARRVGGKHYHLGPLGVVEGPHVRVGHGISDRELAQRYSQSEFVAGLRRCEGFELPAVEGLLCGARPVMFDRPHYRDWFEGFAEFIPERDSFNEVTDSLEALFRQGARPVTALEARQAAHDLSWARATDAFWSKFQEVL